MSDNLNFVLGEIEEQKEAWKADHEEAMACYDVEDTLRRGVGLFALIRLADESWTKKVQAGTVNFDPEKARELHRCYEWWLGPCEHVLRQLEEAEKSFAKVENAGHFRDCVRMARKLAFIDIGGLTESFGQFARGEVQPYDGEALIGEQTSMDGAGA